MQANNDCGGCKRPANSRVQDGLERKQPEIAVRCENITSSDAGIGNIHNVIQ